MSLLDELKGGERISFSLVKSGIVGGTYTSVLVDSVAGYSTARAISTDLASKHANLYPFFKDKVDNINDASKYKYLIIKPNDLSEQLIAIGIPWINESTVKSASTETVRLELYNFEEYKRPALESFLKNAGISYAFSTE